MTGKKIGITTFHRAYNYGAILQAYALQKTLKKMGHKPEFVDYYNPNIYDQYRAFPPLPKKPTSFLKSLLFNLYYYSIMKKRETSFREFIDKEFSTSKMVRNKAEANELDYDVLITGSDQVWNKNIVGTLDDIFALNFCDSAKKISYAASVGEDRFITENKEEYKEKIGKIDFISVRESNTAPVLSEVLGKEVSVVLDPTLLLTKEEWEENINKAPVKEKYLFAYSVGTGSELFYDTARKIAKERGLEIVFFEQSRSNRFKVKAKNYYNTGPKEFLNLLYHADVVVTSSFHGLALSTILEKEFYVVLANKPERLITLLEKMKLTERVVKNSDDIKKESIDWKNVEKRLKDEREKSLRWLTLAIAR